MKNTLENKIKFFAQYWGQFILRHTNWEEGTWFGVHAKSMIFVEEDLGEGYYLELKPLSSITDDEQSIVVAFDKWDRNDERLDFLRSKGYGTSWMGINVDKLVKWGWIKLKD